MKTLVDTSVWVQYLRGKDGPVRQRLAQLLDKDAVVSTILIRIELLNGLLKQNSRAQLVRLLGALTTYSPTSETWTTVEQWAALASGKGERFGVADPPIAALAAENDAAVWSLDGDFVRMAARGWIVVV